MHDQSEILIVEQDTGILQDLVYGFERRMPFTGKLMTRMRLRLDVRQEHPFSKSPPVLALSLTWIRGPAFEMMWNSA